MKLITFTQGGKTRTGVLLDEDRIIDLHATDPAVPEDMLALLQGGDEMLAKASAAAASGEASIALADVKLECPVPRPPRILAVGLNYIDHINEAPEAVRKASDRKVPKTPIIFNKQSTAANGPYDPIQLPAESTELDYEGELAVVIGKTCRRVSEKDALSVVAGFTVLNDVSVRDWQRAAPTMTMGKSWDSHCPMGPVLVTRDEVPDPYNLQVRTTVDGEERQNFNTGAMHFKIETQIAYLSTAFTLLPGDVIATGTSAGVAAFTEGQPWLKEGQVVRIEIDGIGFIENKVVKDDSSFIR